MGIEGKNFGRKIWGNAAQAVTLGNEKYGPFLCFPIHVIDPYTLECSIQPGVGRDLEITVWANAQRATSSGRALFSYDEPKIITVNPPFLVDFSEKERLPGFGVPETPRGPFFIFGANFGTDAKYVQNVVMGSAPCLSWIHV